MSTSTSTASHTGIISSRALFRISSNGSAIPLGLYGDGLLPPGRGHQDEVHSGATDSSRSMSIAPSLKIFSVFCSKSPIQSISSPVRVMCPAATTVLPIPPPSQPLKLLEKSNLRNPRVSERR